MAAASDNKFPKVILEERLSDGSDTGNPAADHRALFLGEDGALHLRDSSGTITAVGGASGITVADEGGDLSTAATKLDFVGAGVVASGTGATKTITIAGGGTGTTYGQGIAYPTSFTGDNDDFAAWTNWADVSAFDTAEILNSTVGHLVTKGASKDQKKRFTLGTAKAAAFDFRWWGVIPDLVYWSAQRDCYVDLALKTSADAHVAGFRLEPRDTSYDFDITCVAGGTRVTTNSGGLLVPRGAPLSLRVTRDGSGNCRWYYGVGLGAAPMATFINGSDDVPYNGSPSGTIARAEILIHTVSGPGATAEFGFYIDAFQSL